MRSNLPSFSLTTNHITSLSQLGSTYNPYTILLLPQCNPYIIRILSQYKPVASKCFKGHEVACHLERFQNTWANHTETRAFRLLVPTTGVILGYYWDNGSYWNTWGLYRDNGEENGNSAHGNSMTVPLSNFSND